MRRLFILAVVTLALCGEGRAAPPARPAVHGGDARGEAEALYAGRCSACHGAQGGGDGPAALHLRPAPPDFRDPRWQAAISDEAIAAAVVRGGSAVGKSWTMAPNPNLFDRPDLTAALIQKVRGFSR